MTAVESDFFDGKCRAFIEGYRLVPEGAVWVRPDGTEIAGEMIAPWRPYAELAAAQREYDLSQIGGIRRENDELLADLAAMIDVVYQTDMERIESDV